MEKENLHYEILYLFFKVLVQNENKKEAENGSDKSSFTLLLKT